MTSIILIVEDDEEDANRAAAAVEAIGGIPLLCSSIDAARDQLLTDERRFHAVILDRNLGGGEPDGLTLIRWLEIERPGIPVIVTSTSATPEDHRTGLTQGAWSYLAKPYLEIDLVVHLRAVFKRYIYHRGHLEVSLENTTAFWDGEPLLLRNKAFIILNVLAQNCDHWVPRRALRRHAWRNATTQNAQLETEISFIRTELRRFVVAPNNPIVFKDNAYRLLAHSVGYKAGSVGKVA